MAERPQPNESLEYLQSLSREYPGAAMPRTLDGQAQPGLLHRIIRTNSVYSKIPHQDQNTKTHLYLMPIHQKDMSQPIAM